MSHSRSAHRIALSEFNRRRAAWQKARREGAADWPGDDANVAMMFWTAIALASGVGRDLPDDVCRQIEVEALYPRHRKFLPDAERFCRMFEVNWNAALAELARARDTARTRAQSSSDERLHQRAADLTYLAEVLGAPAPATPASIERKAA